MLRAVIIVAMVLVSITLNFLQTYHSQRAAERLRRQVALTATVLRDRTWTEVPRREVVPGDTVAIGDDGATAEVVALPFERAATHA